MVGVVFGARVGVVVVEWWLETWLLLWCCDCWGGGVERCDWCVRVGDEENTIRYREEIPAINENGEVVDTLVIDVRFYCVSCFDEFTYFVVHRLWG